MSEPSSASRPDGADVVLAVKDLLHAKTRLAGVLSAEHRARLVLAMLCDTLAAAGRSSRVAALHVVTRDAAVAAAAERCGAAVLTDPPTEGLNPALAHAAATVGARWVVALQPDLAALRPAELNAAVAAAQKLGGRCVHADREGSGTTLLSALDLPLQPTFGPDSAARHQRSGAQPLAGPWPGLRCDVDTLDDLAAAVLLGVGPSTAAVLDAMGTPATVAEHNADAALLRTDDGMALRCSGTAVRLGGWRQLRTGQRVRAHRDIHGAIVLLTAPALSAPG